MRRKETSADYRYFPEPDLVRIEIDERWKEEVRASLPELPVRRRLRFQEKLGLSDYDAAVLTEDRAMADRFEECLGAGLSTSVVGAHGSSLASPKVLANWFINDGQSVLNEQGVEWAELKMLTGLIAELVSLVERRVLNVVNARAMFAEWVKTRRGQSTIIIDPETGQLRLRDSEKTVPLEQIVREKGLAQISDESAIVSAVDRALAANAKSVADYKGGKKAAFNALLGAVMRETKGKANPQVVRQILEKRLAAQ
jgi:aspartyl-tRNA(Asn)/glutamyl-tRNA(Gln) amidotransferase subunit B